MFDLDQAANIPDLFTTGRVALVQPHRQDLWDAPLLWGTLLVAIFLEWLLRKRYRLV